MGYIFRSYIADDRRLRSHKTVFFASIPDRTADMPAKLNSSQLRRHVGGKGLRWLLLPKAYVLICRNGIPSSTGDCVAGSSAAYENQAFTDGVCSHIVGTVSQAVPATVSRVVRRHMRTRLYGYHYSRLHSRVGSQEPLIFSKIHNAGFLKKFRGRSVSLSEMNDE